MVNLFQGIFKLVGCPRSSVLPLKSGHGEFDSRCHCEWIGKLQDGELDLLVRAVGCEGCNEKYVIECLPGCCYSLCTYGRLSVGGTMSRCSTMTCLALATWTATASASRRGSVLVLPPMPFILRYCSAHLDRLQSFGGFGEYRTLPAVADCSDIF